MKKLWVVISALLINLIIPTTINIVEASNEKTIDIYLIAGQSNAVGQTDADVSALNQIDSRFSTGFSNVLYYGNTDLNVGETSPDNLELQRTKLGLGKKTNEYVSMGPEAGMGFYLSNEKPNDNFGLIKYASGSSSIYDDIESTNNKNRGNWYSEGVSEALGVDPKDEEISGNCYRTFLDVVAKGLTAYRNAGFTPVIKGLAWMQGEQECNSNQYSKEYAKMLTALISDFRTDLTTISGQDLSQMHVVLAKIPSSYLSQEGAFTNVVREQQQLVDNNDQYVSSIDNDGFILPGAHNYTDKHHYYWTDMLVLGMNFAEALLNGSNVAENNAKFVCSEGGSSLLVNKTAKAGDLIETSLMPQIGYELTKDSIKFIDGSGKVVNVKYSLDGNFLVFLMPEYDVTVYINFFIIPQFKINISVENGIVYQTNSTRDPYRDDKVTFTFVPNEGYELSSVTHNGFKVPVANIDDKNEYKTYTVTVSEDIELDVKFTKVEVSEEEPKEETPTQELKFINVTLTIILPSIGGIVVLALLVILLFVRKKRA